jgi:hypothetical protein
VISAADDASPVTMDRLTCRPAVLDRHPGRELP